MAPITETDLSVTRFPSFKISVALPDYADYVRESQTSGVKVLAELANQGKEKDGSKNKPRFKIAYWRQEPAHYLVTSDIISNDYFHTVPVLIVENAPKALLRELPELRYQEEENRFVSNSSNQGAYVTRNEAGKKIIVVPEKVLEVALLSGNIPCSKIVDGDYRPDNVVSGSFIPSKDVFKLVSEAFPLDAAQLDFFAKLETQKT